MARLIHSTPRTGSMNAIEVSMNTLPPSESLLADEQTTFGMKRSLQNWFRNRRSASPSPTRSLHSPRPTAVFASPARAHTSPEEHQPSRFRQSRQDRYTNGPGHPFPLSDSKTAYQAPALQNGTVLPTSRRRRSSARLRNLLAPEDFTIADLRKPLELSRNICRLRVGYVTRPYHLEAGWRIVTRPRSPETCFVSSLPIYSAHHHSPLITGLAFTIYFECEIRPVHSDDPVCLTVGFVAGKDRALKMPGFERGSIGVNARDGGLYLNNELLESGSKGLFEPGQQIGIGMTFSLRDHAPHQADDAPATTGLSVIQVEGFVSRDGRRVATLDLGDQSRVPLDLFREGFEGGHDIYAAVGTRGEVDVDIFFEK